MKNKGLWSSYELHAEGGEKRLKHSRQKSGREEKVRDQKKSSVLDTSIPYLSDPGDGFRAREGGKLNDGAE